MPDRDALHVFTTDTAPMIMSKPMFKADYRPLLRTDGTIWFGHVYGLASEIRDESGLVWPLCGLLDGASTLDEIVDRMVREHGAEPDEVRELVRLFQESGWLVDREAAAPESLSQRDLERHRSTVEFFSNIDAQPRTSPYDVLARLRETRVTVLGVGGVGGAVASGLVATGFGRVRLVDDDQVELSNLNRQLLFGTADIGRPKAQAAAERLRALDEGCDVTWRRRRIAGVADVRELIAGSDLVCCCADDPAELRLWVNEACFEAGVPWFCAAYSGSRVALATYIPGQTGCYSCLLAANTRRREELGLPSLERAPVSQTDGGNAVNPVIAASAQFAGHSMALEAAYLRLGFPVQTAGRELHRQLTDYTFHYFVEARPQPDCPVACGERAEG